LAAEYTTMLGVPGEATRRPNEDDASPASVAHSGTELADQRERSNAVQRDLPQPELEGLVEEEAHVVHCAGVVNQQPYFESRGCSCELLGDVRFREVERERPDLYRVAVSDLRRDVVEKGTVRATRTGSNPRPASCSATYAPTPSDAPAMRVQRA
jgi:hypothetical protein